ncbi:MAG: DUF4199 domain-containing protein [Bacteroidetes bacterium]|nr:DUF4199 domain-containing protein [Bacteroidota bacterium]
MASSQVLLFLFLCCQRSTTSVIVKAALIITQVCSLGMLLCYPPFRLYLSGSVISRDKYNNGVITFGKAFRTGLYIVLIASTIYVLAWLVDYFFFIPDFMDKYAAHMVDELKASGASAAEIEKQTTEMAEFGEMYKIHSSMH